MKTALYTTVHLASRPYLEPFFGSVAAQTDLEFDFWLGVDALRPEALGNASVLEEAHFVVAEPGDTPASLRGRAWAQIVTLYDAVIFVDSDDVLYPERVAAAKKQLELDDVGGCALELIAENGVSLNKMLKAPLERDWNELLPRCNVFGLSNTAYRCEVLAKTLPLPRDVAVVDWLVVTRAYLAGARLGFDTAPRMGYRQYESNTAQVTPPFTSAGIVRATAHVLTHLQCVLQGQRNAEQYRRFGQRLTEVQRFSERVQGDTLSTYTQKLNARTQPVYLWWACVAHEELTYLWS